MNIKRSVDQNYKLIGLVIIGIIFILFIIKALNLFYEQNAEREHAKLIENNNQTVNNEKIKGYSTENNSIEETIASFINYCNKREIQNAYKMLTEECKVAMFPTVEDFERIYINNVYNIERQYEMLKWDSDGDKHVYQIKLYGDILATGNLDGYKEEYYTFIQNDNGSYKLNINNYIYGEDRDIRKVESSMIVEIGHVDVYEEYETATITITNNSTKTICLTGDKYRKNIYLENNKGSTYSSLNSEFDNKEIILEPKDNKTFKVNFNKGYNSSNNANYLVLSDVILDYEEYLKSVDKANYSNRTSIKIKYQK